MGEITVVDKIILKVIYLERFPIYGIAVLACNIISQHQVSLAVIIADNE